MPEPEFELELGLESELLLEPAAGAASCTASAIEAGLKPPGCMARSIAMPAANPPAAPAAAVAAVIMGFAAVAPALATAPPPVSLAPKVPGKRALGTDGAWESSVVT